MSLHHLGHLFAGIPLHADKVLCRHPFTRPSRPHRRRRIQKKWIKRHGLVAYGCKGDGSAYHMAGCVVACPHAIEIIRKATQCAV